MSDVDGRFHTGVISSQLDVSDLLSEEVRDALTRAYVADCQKYGLAQTAEDLVAVHRWGATCVWHLGLVQEVVSFGAGVVVRDGVPRLTREVVERTLARVLAGEVRAG